MRLHKARRGSGCEINMTPMIDMIFQLIIFFMCVSQFSRIAVENVTLPEAKKGTPLGGETAGRIIVNVTKDGLIVLSGQTHNGESLKAAIEAQAKGAAKEKTPVVLRADRDCPWENARSVLEACEASGIGRVRVAVTPPQGGAAEAP